MNTPNLLAASVLSAVLSFFGLQTPNNIQPLPTPALQQQVQQVTNDIFQPKQSNTPSRTIEKDNSVVITDNAKTSTSNITISSIKLIDIGLQPTPNKGENITEFPLGQVFDMSAIFDTGDSSSNSVLKNISVEVSDPDGHVVTNVDLDCEKTQSIFYCANNVWNTSNLSPGQKRYKFTVKGTDSLKEKIQGSIVRDFMFKNVSTDLCKAVYPQHNSDNVSKNKINLIFVGAGYSNVEGESFSEVFTKVAAKLIDLGATGHGLFSVKPFKSNDNLFNYWYVDKSHPLEQCTLINHSCSKEEIIKLSESCPYPNSYLVEVHDRNAYDQEVGASARSVVVAMPYSKVSDPTQSAEADSLQRTFTHEFAHTFADLGDEYVIFPDQAASQAQIDIQRLNSVFQTHKNIFYGSLNECLQDAPWHKVPGTECVVGGGKIGLNAFRPTENSLMRDPFLDPFTFGPYNSLLIQDRFDRFLVKSRLTDNQNNQGTSTKTPVISNFTANPTFVSSGQSVVLSWKVASATRCIIQSGSSEESVSVSGSKTVTPTQTTSYKLWCVNDPGTGKDGPSAEHKISVVVNNPPPSAFIDKDSLISTPGTPVTLTGYAHNIVQPFGISISQNGEKIWGSGNLTLQKGLDGDRWVSKVNQSLSAGSYQVQVFSNNILVTSATLTIRSIAPTCSLISDKSSYTLGEKITYSWTSQNATYASWQEENSSGGYTWLPGDKLPANGSRQLKASDIGKVGVVLQVSGPNGSGSCSASVNISAPAQVSESAIIDQHTLKVIPNTQFSLSGGTSVKGGPLTVAIVGPGYTGNTDWNTIGSIIKSDAGLYTGVSKTISVVEGNWSAPFSGIVTEGYYVVLIYDNSYNLIGKGTLWITFKG